MTSDHQTSVVDHTLADRRRYRREQVDLAGRQFEPTEKLEAVCKIVDLSVGGARVRSHVVPKPGTFLVIYIEGFGRFEGCVAHAEQDSFGIQFNCSAQKRERLAEALALHVNGRPLEKTALRRHDRTPISGNASFTRANGHIVKCKLVDFSLSGVSVATDIRPPIGEVVLIGPLAGRVARHHDTGIGIEFVGQNRRVA